MLKERSKRAVARPVPHFAEHRLWHDELRNTPSLGCLHCPERRLCGGLSVAAGLMNCLDLCCGEPDRCDKPCRNNPDYALRVREVGTFSLDTVPRASVLRTPKLPLVVPVLFHGKRRAELVGPDPIALPLYALFNRRDGALRFESHEALCTEFGLVPGTAIILTGTDQDPPLERWWGYEDKRRKIVRGLKALGIVLTTTPNFSLFVDVPRHVDLHAIKRIGLVHQELLDEGLPTALHVNGRSETDFRRWGAYVRERPEVTHLAYEFTTGTSRILRRDLHANWLASVAATADRPLDLIVRGGIDLLPRLSQAFDRITVLETWSFMKTIKRQRAVPRDNASPSWFRAPSAIGAPLDALFASNRTAIRQWIEGQASTRAVTAKAAANE